MENKEIINWLIWIHSTLTVLEYKVEVSHWNEKWEWFLYIHSKFWDLYSEIENQEDVIAERIIQLKWNTSLTLEETLKNSIIKEKKNLVWVKKAIREINQDLILLEWVLKWFSQEISNDLATQQLVLDLQILVSKRIFLFSSELEWED